MKKTLISAIFIAFLAIAPSYAHAFDPLDFLDPVRVIQNIPVPSFEYNSYDSYDYYDKGTNSYDYYRTHPQAQYTTAARATVTPTPAPAPVTVVNNNYNYNTNNVDVNSGGGNGGYNYPNYPNYPSYEPLRVSCYSTPTRANVGDSVGWRTSIQGGNGDYYVTWSGSEGLSGYGQNITKRYHSSGSKHASVTVRSDGRTMTMMITMEDLSLYHVL
jgi:hypothetical protein